MGKYVYLVYLGLSKPNPKSNPNPKTYLQWHVNEADSVL